MRFHMSHVTLKFHRVCLEWLPSLRYVRRKPCTYHASRLEVSQNRPKWAPTWASSPRSTIGCMKLWFLSLWYIFANRAPILHGHWHCLQTERNKVLHDPRYLGVPSGASKMISEPSTLGANRAPILHQD
jgi:hypothetical protein